MEDSSAFLDMLLRWSCDQAEDGLERECVWHLLASVVNKREEGESSNLDEIIHRHPTTFIDLNAFLTSQLDSFWTSEVTTMTDSNPEKRRNAIKAWTWVCVPWSLHHHAELRSDTTLSGLQRLACAQSS